MTFFGDRNNLEIDRDAVASVLVEQCAQHIKSDRNRLGLTNVDVERLIDQYRHSDALQRAVDAEVEKLTAHLTGRIH